MILLFVLLAMLYALGMALRLAIAGRWLAQPGPAGPGSGSGSGTADEGSVTVLVPILSGDPALKACLAANLANAPRARFLLLIDEDDAEARAITTRLAAPNATALSGPAPAPGENPKVAKLARALPRVTTAHVAVLDDDTVLPPGALGRTLGHLETGDLVTGLPVYAPGEGLFTRLLAAFVNGSVLITYPVGAALGQARTLNGMFYVTRSADLRSLGGFEAIRGSLTDDYAMARLYLDAGLRLVQSRIIHQVQTTVTGPGHYLSIMRRWMIFARAYLRENRTLFTLGLIGGTALAPPLLLLLGLGAGGPVGLIAGLVVVSLLLGAKAHALRRLRGKVTGQEDPPGQIPLEMLADLLLPFHMLTALVRPGRLRWRTRRIVMEGDRITYD